MVFKHDNKKKYFKIINAISCEQKCQMIEIDIELRKLFMNNYVLG